MPPLLGWLRGTRLAPVMVIHANHPAELQGPAAAAIERLVDAGVPVLNQSVLLAGVNDDVEVLAALSERLVDLRRCPIICTNWIGWPGRPISKCRSARGLELIAGSAPPAPRLCRAPLRARSDRRNRTRLHWRNSTDGARLRCTGSASVPRC